MDLFSFAFSAKIPAENCLLEGATLFKTIPRVIVPWRYIIRVANSNSFWEFRRLGAYTCAKLVSSIGGTKRWHSIQVCKYLYEYGKEPTELGAYLSFDTY